MYKIQIEYETGNSFGLHEETETIEYTWEKYEVAQVNLQRIKEHYDWYQNEHGSKLFRKNVKRPKFTHPKWDTSISLVMDDGTEQYYSTFWTGFFETLLVARIILADSGILF